MSVAISEQPLIRHATREDVPSILALIRELADYEHELSSVEATEESLLATLSFAISPNTHAQPRQSNVISTYSSDTTPTSTTLEEALEPISPSRSARCLLLFPPSTSTSASKGAQPAQAVGLALYYHTYSTWRSKPGIYLEDLFVKPEFRGKGYGKALISELAKLVRVINGGRLEWSVLRWNKPSIDFYEKVIGAKEMGEWMGMRVDGKGLDKLAEGRL